MADIPANTYTVTINDTVNNWANGVLNTNVTPPTYKGQPVWSGYNLSTTDVSWTVTLNHAGTECNVAFSGGVYSPPPPAGGTIAGQTVTSTCFTSAPEAPVDSWSAEGGGGQDEKIAYA
jgi:hypothetical protein